MTGSKKKTNPLPKTSMLQGLLAAAAAIDPGTVEMPQFSDKCQHWKPVITEPSDYLRGLIAHRFQLLDEYEAMVAAAKAKAGRASQLAVQEGVQMHGGMGMTDELNVGHYFKRISSINIQFGDPAYHVLRYAQLDAAA